ncbi:DUF1428 domain-containing protein [Altererythrobacter aquiaggeris]|uniref:DUF1428 domain-containing protein n=1 Tax=Aestuarierythrobacter aquiaggeris TaxID=1898396 RepID=UPI00301B120A
MPYIEGFLAPVPSDKKDEYLAFTKKAAPLFKDIGVTRMVECWGDDLMRGKQTDFYRAVDAKDGETVVFSWMEYPDRETRDEAYVKMENDPRFEEMGEMPMDGKRMIFSGFAPIFDTAGELA